MELFKSKGEIGQFVLIDSSKQQSSVFSREVLELLPFGFPPPLNPKGPHWVPTPSPMEAGNWLWKHHVGGFNGNPMGFSWSFTWFVVLFKQKSSHFCSFLRKNHLSNLLFLPEILQITPISLHKIYTLWLYIKQ